MKTAFVTDSGTGKTVEELAKEGIFSVPLQVSYDLSLIHIFRGTSMQYVKELSQRAIDCVEGACKASGCTYQVTTYECPYEDCVKMCIRDSIWSRHVHL